MFESKNPYKCASPCWRSWCVWCMCNFMCECEHMCCHSIHVKVSRPCQLSVFVFHIGRGRIWFLLLSLFCFCLFVCYCILQAKPWSSCLHLVSLCRSSGFIVMCYLWCWALCWFWNCKPRPSNLPNKHFFFTKPSSQPFSEVLKC